MNKLIKSMQDYEKALAMIEELIKLDPDVDTSEGEKLELMTLLVEDYESKNFEQMIPDPIEAIKFRMEQENLSPRDLIPYLGSRSKVSEVLSGKRSLTISMMQAIHNGLGIPAKILLQNYENSELNKFDIEWERFPIHDMVARGWIQESISDVSNNIEEVIRKFFIPLESLTAPVVLYRMTNHIRSARKMDKYSLVAWTARVMIKAQEDLPPVNYIPGTVTINFMQEVVRLSLPENGPLLARDFLRKYGIHLIIEPHLPRTHLDGSTIMNIPERPLIALTLRHDRTDNFWFTLMHELAHLSLHFSKESTQFYDDLDVEGKDDLYEQDADKLASEALIPQYEWKKSPASNLRSPEAANHLANKIGIHPAIVAGRMRHEYNSYRLLNRLIGHKQVRKLFTEIDWEK